VFVEFINEIEVEQGVFENRTLRIRDNPGFSTEFEMEKYTTTLIIKMSLINNIYYLDVIPIYLKALLEISQGLVKSPLCTKKPIEEKKKSDISEIVAPSDKPFGENETPVILPGEELDFDDGGDDDMLDFLMNSEDEGEGEDEEQMEGGGIQYGGMDTPTTKDITGMPLANPNYFSNRMEERDPSLFLKQKSGKFNAYSRMCASNLRRQPVILTQEEKDRIDRDHPDSYKHSIKYGSDPEKPYYYICPRYWCIPKNTSISEEEVEAGVCGGRDAIIPFNAKKVPKGKTIYEFSAPPENTYAHKEYFTEDGKYIQHYPGFISGDKHPEGKCMPCCFKSWEAKEQIRRRQECSQDKSLVKKKVAPRRIYTDTQKEYIKGSDKFPIEKDRWGFLPMELQLFLQENNALAQESEMNPVIKKFTPTLLRKGVEPNINQSFISCIADVYATTLKITKVPTVKQMREIIKKAITVDNFSNFQNGNLISEFYDISREVEIDKYSESLLYNKLTLTDEKQLDYLERIISAYENFMEFLADDEIYIDYQYLWDIICTPNKELFPSGMNLIIFEIPEEDYTNNIELVCPTNIYSNHFYDHLKNSLILVEKNNYFEPVYLYTDNGVDKKNEKVIDIQKMFNERSLKGKLHQNLKVTLSAIKKNMNEKCVPLNSLPTVYTFKENIIYDELVYILRLSNISIRYTILHYNGKAVGVFAKLPNGDKGFIPCYPSSYIIKQKTKIRFIDDSKNWKTYEETIDFLTNVKKLTKKKKKNLPCLPKMKVIEDGLIIGILTETNQFIQVSKPIPDVPDELDSLNADNYIDVGVKSITQKQVDSQRVNFVNNFNNENNNFKAFRNIARIHLNNYENRGIKNQISSIISNVNNDSLKEYEKNLKEIIGLLKELLKNEVHFSKNPEIEKYEFPENNLLTDQKNRELYFSRLADELLRFRRIQLFLLEANKYLSFSEISYQLREDEILLLESLITQEYFEGMKAYKRNKFVHFNTFDNTMPLERIKFSNKIDIAIDDVCNTSLSNITEKWSSFFPKNFTVTNYSNTVYCTYDLIITLLKFNQISKSKKELQNILYQEYKKINHERLFKLLIYEGKLDRIRQIRSEQLTFEQYILSDHYHLTLYDLWTLANYFTIPIIFISVAKYKNINNKKIFATRTAKNNTYSIIRTFAPKSNQIPKYKLFESPSTGPLIDITIAPKIKTLLDFTKGLSKKNPQISDYLDKF
jgi:hypothetical protein